MPYNPTNCKFGFLTDTHFSVVRNSFRTDGFFESVLSKFKQCYDYFNASGCEFVLHGGDMFDKYRSYSYPMILQIRDVIVKSKIPTYFIWGQHDLMGYNRASSRNSNLEFLQQICDNKLIEIKDFVELKSVYLFASHVDQDCIDVLRGINPRIIKPVVSVVHALLFNAESSFGTIDVRKIGKIKPVLVLSGDLHSGFEQTEIENTVYYNPGSLARTSREKRKPKAAVIEMTPFMNEWSINIKEFFPKCEEFPFPEAETADITVSDQQDSEEYIEAFEKFKAESTDIIERLEQVGKHHNIDSEVLEYIKSKGHKDDSVC